MLWNYPFSIAFSQITTRIFQFKKEQNNFYFSSCIIFYNFSLHEIINISINRSDKLFSKSNISINLINKS